MAYRVYDFDYGTPTQILFGKDKIERLPEVLGAFGKKVLLVYGGGSIRKMGIYDRVQSLLKGFEIYECPGVEPNPRVTSADKGAARTQPGGIRTLPGGIRTQPGEIRTLPGEAARSRKTAVRQTSEPRGPRSAAAHEKTPDSPAGIRRCPIPERRPVTEACPR